MLTVMIICIIIVFVVILISVLTTNKAYKFKHTVDPLPPDQSEKQHDESYKQL